MPWPIPQPGDVFNRAAGVFESELARIYLLKNPHASPSDVHVDARSPYSQAGIYSRVADLSTQELWFYQSRLAAELMVDTAIDWLPRHAAIWGVPQIQALPATGSAIFVSVSGVPVPAGLALSVPGGLTYVTTAAVTIAPASTASIPIACTTAGASGSLPAATALNVVNPLAGLTTQTATVAAGGLTGEDAETIDQWRDRIKFAVRNRGAGGNGNDFDRWTREALPGAFPKSMSPGTGFVTVAFAMPAGLTWRAPAAPEIAAVSLYLNDAQNRKPLGSPVITVAAATLQPVNFSLHLNLDTAANRAAAINVLTLQILSDATIGGTLFMSRIDAALQNASGEFSHERAAPAADVTAAATTLSVISAVAFT